MLEASQTPVLVFGLKHAIDFGDEVFQVKRLGQQFRLGRGAAALERHGGEAGDEHYTDRGVDRAGLLGKFDSVHLGHDNVGQEQVVLARLDQWKRLGSAADGLDVIADALQRALQIFAHRRIVFGKENPDHPAMICAHRLKFSTHLGDVVNLLSENSTLRVVPIVTEPPHRPDPPAIDIIRGRTPVLLSVPHSGRDYPSALIDRSRLGRAVLERLEDPLVELLVAGAIDRGAGAVVARAPRALIDCNRAEEELDPRAVAGRGGEAPTARSRAGLGMLPTRLAAVGDLWRAPISEAELAERLDRVHRPYHAALAAELDDRLRRWDEVVLLDCHSMPPRRRGEANVIIGDRHGTSAAAWVSETAAAIAARLGFAVARNDPFAGGHIVARHGRPPRGIHAIQVEVDRSCYCLRDARTAGPGFSRVARMFEALSSELAELLARRGQEAAE